MRSSKWLALAVAAMMTAACSLDQGPGEDRFGTLDAALIALDTDGMAGDMMLGHIMMFGGFDAVATDRAAGERTFAHTRECPAGGSVSVEGTATRTRSDKGVEWTFSAKGAWNACAHKRNDVTVTRTGTWEQSAYRRIANGAFVGPQTSTKRGSFAWSRSTGQSGECSFDVTSTRDPEAGTRTVKGNVCGREIDRTVTWKRGEG